MSEKQRLLDTKNNDDANAKKKSSSIRFHQLVSVFIRMCTTYYFDILSSFVMVIELIVSYYCLVYVLV